MGIVFIPNQTIPRVKSDQIIDYIVVTPSKMQLSHLCLIRKMYQKPNVHSYLCQKFANKTRSNKPWVPNFVLPNYQKSHNC